MPNTNARYRRIEDGRPYGTRIRSVRVDDDLWDKAAAKAREKNENMSIVVRRALARYVAPTRPKSK
jgi:hypothetical protein